jgi:hypothetical protein
MGLFCDPVSAESHAIVGAKQRQLQILIIVFQGVLSHAFAKATPTRPV